MSKTKHTKRGRKALNFTRPTNDFDYVFRKPPFKEQSVRELLSQGIAGLTTLAQLIELSADNADAYKMYSCVAMELDNRMIELLYYRRPNETLRSAVEAVSKVMDLVPEFELRTLDIALGFGYDNIYEMIRNCSDEDIQKICVCLIGDTADRIEKYIQDLT